MRFDGTGEIVTGAASGIGAATADSFAQEEARVVGMDSNNAPELLHCGVTDPVSVADRGTLW